MLSITYPRGSYVVTHKPLTGEAKWSAQPPRPGERCLVMEHDVSDSGEVLVGLKYPSSLMVNAVVLWREADFDPA